jgi:hypothetical protein
MLGFRLALVNVGSLVVVALEGTFPGGAVVRWVALAVLAALAAHGMQVGGALLVAAVAWLYGVGFVSHELGVLTPLGRAEIAWGLVLALAGASGSRWSHAP